jgi:hypothetical protein
MTEPTPAHPALDPSPSPAPSLRELVRTACVTSGYVTDPRERGDIADVFIDTVKAAPGITWMIETASSGDTLDMIVQRRTASGWLLLHRIDRTRALLIRPEGVEPSADASLVTDPDVAVLDAVCNALELLLDYTDRHRVTHPAHDHDCYEHWSIERDYARQVLADARKIRHRGEPQPEGTPS